MHSNFGIVKEITEGEYTVLLIDPRVATYREHRLNLLGHWGRRKLENLIIGSRPKERLKIIYTDREIYIPTNVY